MFRKMYDSLSMDVHLELLIKGDLICLKSWQPISQEDYENDTSQLEREMFWAGERSLNSAYLADYMQWPADVSGVFHTRMPSMKMAGSNKIMGEEFLPNIPAVLVGQSVLSDLMMFRLHRIQSLIVEMQKHIH